MMYGSSTEDRLAVLTQWNFETQAKQRLICSIELKVSHLLTLSLEKITRHVQFVRLIVVYVSI